MEIQRLPNKPTRISNSFSADNNISLESPPNEKTTSNVQVKKGLIERLGSSRPLRLPQFHFLQAAVTSVSFGERYLR